MKRILKIARMIILGILGILLIFLFTVKIWNHIAMSSEKELWVNSHRELVNASRNGRFVQLECGHYVHNYESERIAGDIKELLH